MRLRGRAEITITSILEYERRAFAVIGCPDPTKDDGMVATFKHCLAPAQKPGETTFDQGQGLRTFSPSYIPEAVCSHDEIVANGLLLASQHVHGESGSFDEGGKAPGGAGWRPENERRIERDRREAIGRDADRLSQVVASSHDRDARGEVPQRGAERACVAFRRKTCHILGIPEFRQEHL